MGLLQQFNVYYQLVLSVYKLEYTDKKNQIWIVFDSNVCIFD